VTDNAAAAAPISLGAEFARKGIHLGSSLAPILFAYVVPRRAGILILGVLAAVAVGIEWARRREGPVRSLVQRAFGPMLRSQESAGGWTGATWMLIAYTLVAALFPDVKIAAASMLAVSWGDGVAAIVGRVMGRHKLPGSRKTLEGSAACLLATFLGASLVARLGPIESLVGALAGTIAEVLDQPLDDNIRVAIATGAGIFLWRMVLFS
jgi:dolichol kinase